MELRNLKSFTGIRCEELWGEGHRDTIAVGMHESFELENEDLADTLGLDHDEKIMKEALTKISKDGYSQCVWVCLSKEDLIDSYIKHREDMNPEEVEYTEYTFEDCVVLSDIGTEGLLIGYKNEPALRTF